MWGPCSVALAHLPAPLPLERAWLLLVVTEQTKVFAASTLLAPLRAVSPTLVPLCVGLWTPHCVKWHHRRALLCVCPLGGITDPRHGHLSSVRAVAATAAGSCPFSPLLGVVVGMAGGPVLSQRTLASGAVRFSLQFWPRRQEQKSEGLAPPSSLLLS